MFVCTLVRHGQTVNNLSKMIQSRTDGELNEKGIWMAETLGEYLQDEKFTHIFSSDLKRCRDTTENIVSKLKSHPEVQFTPLLRERDYGDYEFKHEDHLVKSMKEEGLLAFECHKAKVTNGESYAECRDRAARFFSQILKLADIAEGRENVKENILAVSHGCLISCLLESFVENPEQFEMVNFDKKIWEELLEAPNTSRTRFTITTRPSNHPEKKPKRILTFTNFFDTQHLNTD